MHGSNSALSRVLAADSRDVAVRELQYQSVLSDLLHPVPLTDTALPRKYARKLGLAREVKVRRRWLARSVTVLPAPNTAGAPRTSAGRFRR
jgi:hypothetical protein